MYVEYGYGMVRTENCTRSIRAFWVLAATCWCYCYIVMLHIACTEVDDYDDCFSRRKRGLWIVFTCISAKPHKSGLHNNDFDTGIFIVIFLFQMLRAEFARCWSRVISKIDQTWFLGFSLSKRLMSIFIMVQLLESMLGNVVEAMGSS